MMTALYHLIIFAVLALLTAICESRSDVGSRSSGYEHAGNIRGPINFVQALDLCLMASKIMLHERKCVGL